MRAHLILIFGLALAAGVAGSAAPRQQPSAPQSTAQTAPDPKTALIMGQVVDADTNAPVPGALVRLTMRGAAPANVAANDAGRGARGAAPGVPFVPLQLLELTDTDGRFIFHGLSKGAAALSATAPGYINPPGAMAGLAQVMRPVTLKEGEQIFDQKLRLVRTATVSGTVIDEAGEPAVGARVRAVRRDAPGSGNGNADSSDATTDDRGVYRLIGIAPGNYVVLMPQTQTTIPAQAADDMLSSAMSGSLGGLMGDLMASGGPEVMGAMGGIRVGDVMWTSGGGGAGRGAGASGALAPGPVPVLNERMYAYQTTYYPSASSAAQATVLTLRSGDTRESVDFQMRPSLTSRVRGVVTGPSGPVKNLSVRLVAAADADVSGSVDVAVAVTGNDGAFTMLGVPAGSYVAKALKEPTADFREMMAAIPGAADAMPAGLAGFMPQGNKESLSGQAVVSVGAADVTGVALVMLPGAHVRGRVDFQGTTAKPTAQVLQQTTIMLAPVTGPRTGMRIDRLKPTGEFTTSGYAPGRYNLQLALNAGTWMLKSVMAGGRDVTNDAIDLRSTDMNDVVFTYTDQISNINGTVRPPATGTLDDISVIWVPADYQKWYAAGGATKRSPIATLQAAGAFTIGRVPPGDYLLAAIDSGALQATQDVAFYDRLARSATRVSVSEGEKKTVTLDVVKVVK